MQGTYFLTLTQVRERGYSADICILFIRVGAKYSPPLIDQQSECLCSQLGMVAHSYNPATGRLGSEDGLRPGDLHVTALCRSGVRAKPCVDMVTPAEVRVTRLSEEGCTGPGRKRSRQKFPHGAVVG